MNGENSVLLSNVFKEDNFCYECITKKCNKHDENNSFCFPTQFTNYIKHPIFIEDLKEAIEKGTTSTNFYNKKPFYTICKYIHKDCINCNELRMHIINFKGKKIPLCYSKNNINSETITVGIHIDLKLTFKDRHFIVVAEPLDIDIMKLIENAKKNITNKKNKINNKPIEQIIIENKHTEHVVIENKHTEQVVIENKPIGHVVIENKHIEQVVIENKHTEQVVIENKQVEIDFIETNNINFKSIDENNNDCQELSKILSTNVHLIHNNNEELFIENNEHFPSLSPVSHKMNNISLIDYSKLRKINVSNINFNNNNKKKSSLEVESLKNTTKELDRENETLFETKLYLEKENERLKSEIKKLNIRMSLFDKQYNDLCAENYRLKRENKCLNIKFDNVKDIIKDAKSIKIFNEVANNIFTIRNSFEETFLETYYPDITYVRK